MSAKKTMMDCRVESCPRSVAKPGDLCCPAHWKLVPKDLRQRLLQEQRARPSKDKQGRVIAVASMVLLLLESMQIQLPPEES